MKSSKMFGIVLAVITMTLSLCFGGAQGARAAGSFYGSFDVGGFYGGFLGEDQAQGSYFEFGLSSAVHRISHVSTQFSTAQNDPSEGHGFMSINGIKNWSLNQDEVYFNSSLLFGDVYFSQSMSVSYHLGHNDTPYNHGFTRIQLLPFDLSSASMFYGEYEFTNEYGEPFMTIFWFGIDFYGSFGPGALGDARGLPFVPAPGTAGLAFVGALCAFRRRRKVA